MIKIFRFIAVVISIVTIIAMFGCNAVPDTDNNGDKQSNSDLQNTDAQTTPEILDTDLTMPSTVKFDGTTINIIIRSNYTTEFCADQMTGEQLNDAIYEREIETETTLGVDLNYITCETGSQNSTFHDRVRASVYAGDKEFDLVAGYAYYLPSLASEGVFSNWHNVENIDFTRAWWGSRSKMSDSLTIDGKLFFISGDASLLYIQKAFGVFANTTLLDENNIDINTLYAAVHDGTWTLDRLMQVSSDLSKDLNGDGFYTDADQYGFNLYLKTVADNFFYSFDTPIVTADNSGNYTISMNSERMSNVVSKLHSLVYQGNRSFLTTSKGTSVSFFTQRHTAFTLGGLEWYPSFSDMRDDYGVLPYPKYDTNQAAYKTGVSDTYSLFAIPVTCDITDAVGATLEYFGYLSYTNVTPVYYEIVLKGKASRDSESFKMLDIIHDSISFDLGFIYSSALGNPAWMFRTLLADSSSANFASFYAKNAEIYEKGLADLIDTYKKIGN